MQYLQLYLLNRTKNVKIKILSLEIDFFYRLLGYLKANVESLRRNSLTHLMFTSELLYVRPQGHRESRNKVEPQKPSLAHQEISINETLICKVKSLQSNPCQLKIRFSK